LEPPSVPVHVGVLQFLDHQLDLAFEQKQWLRGIAVALGYGALGLLVGLAIGLVGGALGLANLIVWWEGIVGVTLFDAYILTLLCLRLPPVDQ